MAQEYVTIRQLVERVPLSRATIAEWCKRGKLPAVKLGKKWFIRADVLESFLGSGGAKDE